MKNLQQEKIIENEIEKASLIEKAGLELEVEALKEERNKIEKLLKLCEAEAKRRGFTPEEIKELTK